MRTITTILCLSFILSSAWGQDRKFAWSYNSPTKAKGTADIEAWNTYSFGRKGYDYSKLKQSIEFEYGVTDKIQTSVYLNGKHTNSGPKDTTDLSSKKSSTFSFSNAWKFQLINPYTHSFGLSAYAEYYLAQDEVEFESKLILDKITEKNWFVFNSVFELGLETEYEKEDGKVESELEKEFKWENSLGYMYNLKPNLGLGLELRNVNKFDKGELEYAAIFAGPSVTITSNKYYLIFNVMPQLTNLAGNNKPLELNDQEKFNFRVLCGVSF